jgi:hypothetical protein
MTKKLVALDLLNTILSKVYTKITNETNKKIETKIEEIAEKGYADDTFIPLTQKAAANGVATLDADGHIPVKQIVDITDETGDEFDYLSIKNDTGIERKSRVHNDYTNSNPNNLIDSSTLYNYNGQWITSEPEPTGRMVPPYSIVFEQTEYTDIPDNEWKVLFSDPMDFSKTPELDKTMAAMVKISDYGQTKQEKYTHYVRLHDSINLDRFLIYRGWTKTTDGSATVYTAPYTTDDGWIEVLYGHKYRESNFNLINKVRVESDNTFLAYYNDTFITKYVSHCIYRYSNISTGVQVRGTVEMTPATTVNPITKLGTVDEGEWKAGSVTTEDLSITDDSFDFNGTEVQLSDMNSFDWVEV